MLRRTVATARRPGLKRGAFRDSLGSMRRLSLALLMMTALAACVAAERPRTAPPVRIERQPNVSAPLHTPGGLDMVMGHNARTLIARFGNPGLDVREGPARKLQFLGPACVLDFYLYPPRGGGDPVVTHIDARLPDGRDTDRAACVETLSRR
jgi:hypothetical protein